MRPDLIKNSLIVCAVAWIGYLAGSRHQHELTLAERAHFLAQAQLAELNAIVANTTETERLLKEDVVDSQKQIVTLQTQLLEHYRPRAKVLAGEHSKTEVGLNQTWRLHHSTAFECVDMGKQTGSRRLAEQSAMPGSRHNS